MVVTPAQNSDSIPFNHGLPGTSHLLSGSLAFVWEPVRSIRRKGCRIGHVLLITPGRDCRWRTPPAGSAPPFHFRARRRWSPSTGRALSECQRSRHRRSEWPNSERSSRVTSGCYTPEAAVDWFTFGPGTAENHVMRSGDDPRKSRKSRNLAPNNKKPGISIFMKHLVEYSFMEPPTGFEPVTPCLQDRCSGQLS